MKNPDLVVINESTPRRLAFYLSLEEYLARNYSGRDFFFAWQVKPTVIIGRNQLLEKEIDVDFCKGSGIDIVRRKSGGGAVVADMNNIMFSYITSSDDVCGTFSDYTSSVVRALRQLGLDASDTSRNDILIGDRKVSGNSYYHLGGRSIVHGTMLYDYDPQLMGQALRPSVAKLVSHGVKSAKSRVTTIKEHLPELSIDDFLSKMKTELTDGGRALTLTSEELKAVERIEQTYYEPSWLLGKNPKGSIHAERRFEGVGEIAVDIAIGKGVISSVALSGDYLENAAAEDRISALLVGTPFERNWLEAALAETDVSLLIPGLTNENLINLIF